MYNEYKDEISRKSKLHHLIRFGNFYQILKEEGLELDPGLEKYVNAKIIIPIKKGDDPSEVDYPFRNDYVQLGSGLVVHENIANVIGEKSKPYDISRLELVDILAVK